MLDVEKPLILPTLQEIDEHLREAENGSRTWSGEGALIAKSLLCCLLKKQKNSLSKIIGMNTETTTRFKDPAKGQNSA